MGISKVTDEERAIYRPPSKNYERSGRSRPFVCTIDIYMDGKVPSLWPHNFGRFSLEERKEVYVSLYPW